MGWGETNSKRCLFLFPLLLSSGFRSTVNHPISLANLTLFKCETIPLECVFERSMTDIPPSNANLLFFPTKLFLKANSSTTEFFSQNSRNITSRSEMAKDLRNSSVIWVRVKNAHAVPYGGVLLGNTVYVSNPRVQGGRKSVVHNRGCYDHVFNFLHRWRAYGHYLLDYVPVLSIISEYYQENAYFIVREKTRFMRDSVVLFGISVDRLITLEESDAIFAKNLYMLQRVRPGIPTALFLYKMRRVFAREWKLDQAAPFRYVFCNRDSRNVTNIGSLLKHISVFYPGLKIQIYNDELSGQSKATARFFNEMLFVMGYHTSGLLNMMFQQTNTVSVVIATAGASVSRQKIFPMLARIFMRHLFLYHDVTVAHRSPKRRLNLTGLIPIVDRALNKARLIGESYRPLPNPQPLDDVMLGRDFQVEGAPDLESGFDISSF
jgi:hypothetical protein